MIASLIELTLLFARGGGGGSGGGGGGGGGGGSSSGGSGSGEGGLFGLILALGYLPAYFIGTALRKVENKLYGVLAAVGSCIVLVLLGFWLTLAVAQPG